MKNLLLILILFPFVVLPDGLWAQLDLEYQTRGDSWKEGVRPKPVSGYDIELISVLTDYREPITGGSFPNQVKLRFYLDKEQPVFLTVRGSDPSHLQATCRWLATKSWASKRFSMRRAAGLYPAPVIGFGWTLAIFGYVVAAQRFRRIALCYFGSLFLLTIYELPFEVVFRRVTSIFS